MLSAKWMRKALLLLSNLLLSTHMQPSPFSKDNSLVVPECQDLTLPPPMLAVPPTKCPAPPQPDTLMSAASATPTNSAGKSWSVSFSLISELPWELAGSWESILPAPVFSSLCQIKAASKSQPKGLNKTL